MSDSYLLPVNNVGLAAAATTDPGTAPQYGLAWDLGTGQWVDAENFRQFVRDVLPVTQQAQQRRARQVESTRLRAQELQLAQVFEGTHDKIGVGLGVTPSEGDNRVELGLKGIANLLGQGANFLLSGPSQDVNYKEYTHRGGLLTEDEWNSFSDATRHYLMDRLHGRDVLAGTVDTVAGIPGASEVGSALEKGYRGLIAGVEQANAPLIPGVSVSKAARQKEFFSKDSWARAWREAQGESLGNALVDSALEPYVDQQTLDRWKRSNSWYQMSSLGTELLATWYVDPGVIATKGIGAGVRFARVETPLRETSAYSRGLTQALRREQITVRNPITKKLVGTQVNRINEGIKQQHDYALSVDAHTFANQPNFRARYRAVDGGAGAYALHWAINHQAEANRIINTPEVRQGLQEVADAKNFDLAPSLDVEDLTWRATLGEPNAWAMLSKLQEISPKELQSVAPGSGTLLDSIKALQTRVPRLEQEAADLQREADAIASGGGKVTGLPMFHQWEVHRQLDGKIADLNEATEALHKYEGYQDWLELIGGNRSPGVPTLSRFSGPSKARWSEVRKTNEGETETRHLFTDNFYGYAHSFVRVPKSAFLKKANTAELHSLDSTLQSINRQFDQFQGLFDYAPAGVREKYLDRAVHAKTPFDRYKIMHDLEETHLIGAIAHKFGVEPALARAIINRIHSERDRAITSILTGQGAVYRTAPSLLDRLTGNDATVQLVGWSDDGETATINVMHGRVKYTYEVPKESLTPRVAPEDPTQTPNYYTPLDTRRLFHQIKHDKQTLDELNAGLADRSKAVLAEAGEWAGTKFNELWKPLQLFRIAWPQRVLMDEGLRATAIFGPMYWITGPGAEAAARASLDLALSPVRYISRKRHGALGVSLKEPDTPGVRVTGDAPTAFVRERQVQSAILLPEVQWPALNANRATQVGKHVRDYEAYKTLKNRAPLLREHLAAAPLTATPIQQQFREYAEKQLQMADEPAPVHPMSVIRDAWDKRTRGNSAKALQEGPWVHDPITGRRLTSGYVVPIRDPENFINLQRGEFADDPVAGLAGWYANNAEMLSRAGIRLVVDPNGDVSLGRLFTNTSSKTGAFKRAAEFAQYVDDVHPGAEVWNLAKPGQRHLVAEADDISPFTEATYRQFASEEIQERVQGDAPLEGESGREVFHGTDDELPTPLLPRDEVDPARGAMVGRGLYTTVDHSIARDYGPILYIVRGSRSGKRYKVWDLDRPVTERQVRNVENWLNENNIESDYRDTIVNALREQTGSFTKRVYGEDDRAIPTWANAYEHLEGDYPDDTYMQDVLHLFLEDQHDVGALTHEGGTRHGHPHQVYVFLHPEDIEVSPLYEGTGKFHTIPEWFSNPRSVENPVPENRIIRKPRKDTREPIAALEGAPNRERQEAGELHARETESQDIGNFITADDWDRFNGAADSPLSWVLRKIKERIDSGKTWKKIVSADGQVIYVESAFANHDGQLFRGLVSSNGVIDVLSGANESGTSLFRRKASGYRSYTPPKLTARAVKNHHTAEHKKAIRYFQVYADTINDHVGSSVLMQKFLHGWDDDRVIDWLDNTPEGQRIVAEVKPDEMPTGVWVDEARAKLNYYVPNRKLQRLLAKGRLNPSDFRKNIADEDLPTIYGPDLEVLDKRRGVGQFLGDVRDRIYKGLGEVPIDRLSRQPFAKAAYDRKMRSLVGSLDSKWLDPEMIERLQKQARAYAMQEVNKNLYSLANQMNFNDMLRFVAPFWNAQAEAITRWGRIVAERPETVARFFAGQRAVYNNFVVIDADGNEVKSGTRPGGLFNLGLYQPEDRVVVPMPKVVRSLLPGLENFTKAGIPIGSANTVLQGDVPLLPSLGPLMTIPADEFLRHVSKTHGVEYADNKGVGGELYRWLFPVGRARDKTFVGRLFNNLAPGWQKRLMTLNDSTGQGRLNVEMQIAREMITNARAHGAPMSWTPDPADVKKAASHLLMTRGIASFILPTQVQFLPKHQYWVDAAHRYQKQYGAQWWDKFVDDKGVEAAIYATSSTNSVGVPPTSKGMEEWAPNQALIEKFPNWTEAILSPDAYMGEFNSDAYGAQLTIPLGPGTNETLRSGTSLRDRLQTDPETKLGWREYRKLNAAIEAELYARGLTNIQQRGAEDLALAKRLGTADIQQKYPAWSRAYHTQSDTIYDDIADLEQMAWRPEFDKRPDWQGVRSYLEIRRKAVNVLEAIRQAGGSASLQAQDNQPLAQWFYNQVGQLVLNNPAFAEFYSRYLSSDDLHLGGGGLNGRPE